MSQLQESNRALPGWISMLLVAVLALGALAIAPAAMADTSSDSTIVLAQEGDDDDDDEGAPEGGVDTGAGGTASDGPGLLPLYLLGGGALAVAGVGLRRKLRADHS